MERSLGLNNFYFKFELKQLGFQCIPWVTKLKFIGYVVHY